MFLSGPLSVPLVGFARVHTDWRPFPSQLETETLRTCSSFSLWDVTVFAANKDDNLTIYALAENPENPVFQEFLEVSLEDWSPGDQINLAEIMKRSIHFQNVSVLLITSPVAASG